MTNPTAGIILEYVIRILVILLMSGLTVKDMVGLVKNYYGDDNLVTFANATWDNRSIDLLNASLCFELIPDTIVDDHSEPNIWSTNLIQTMREAQSILQNRSIFDLVLDENNTIKNNSLNDSSILLSIAMIGYLSNRLAYDIAHSKEEGSLFRDSIGQMFPLLGENGSMTKKEFFAAHDFFITHRHFAHKLELLAASEICRRFQPKFQMQNAVNRSIDRSRVDICDPDRSLRYNGHIFEPSHICLPLPVAQLGMSQDFTSYPMFTLPGADQIYYNSRNRSTTWGRQGAIHIEDHRLMLESGYISRSSARFLMAPGLKNTIMWAMVDVIGVFKQNDGAECSNDATLRQCWLKCQVRVIIRECQCNPFFYRYLLSDEKIDESTFCTVHDYNTCWNRTREAFSNECQGQSCRTLCKFVKYNWQFERSETSAKMQIAFNAKSFFFVEYREMIKISATEFYSQMGGIVGLYLGVSGLTIYACAAFLIRILFEHRKKANDNRNGETCLQLLKQFIFQNYHQKKAIQKALVHYSNQHNDVATIAGSISTQSPLSSDGSCDTKANDHISSCMLRDLQHLVNQLHTKIEVMMNRLDSLEDKYNKWSQ